MFGTFTTPSPAETNETGRKIYWDFMKIFLSFYFKNVKKEEGLK
jgi:hypothetical protein